uniref:VIN3-like protein 2 n=1 Tax=Erigeron canadensis TaxID=72917 RepID=UPI001CB908CC|nr:VIN3-like protein 2 [Erigeron canadensis]
MRNPECGSSAMESVFSGFVLDPEKCNQLSLEDKRKLVHRIAHWSEDAPKILSSLTRKELLEIICAELGKERKYSGVTKGRMIEHLLKLVSKNTKETTAENSLDCSPPKKQKNERPLELPSTNNTIFEDTRKGQTKTRVCLNLACKATMWPNDAFCKRCSCCMCFQFDDNKDPSLWLTCDWDTDSCNEGNEPCGMSCHLNCAVNHNRAGISATGYYQKLDGGFYCVSCGKLNGLMRTWRKQMHFANEARRVDALCLRVSLSHKILEGTVKYQKLLSIVESAAKILESEVGPIGLASVKMDRRLVSRLSCSMEVQKLCSFAIQAYDSSFSNSTLNHLQPNRTPTCRISFEESTPTSVTIVLDYEPHLFEEFFGCRIWHRKSTLNTYPKEATYIVLNPEKRFKLTNLDPSTEYSCMVSFFSKKKILGFWESKWLTSKDTEVNTNTQTDSTTDFPCTPCKSDGTTTKTGPRTVPKKNEYEYAVGVIRGLEHEGHLSKDFRVKLLTWFSLKATMQQRRIVNAFVDALIDDPPSLAEQLLDTFADEICGR